MFHVNMGTTGPLRIVGDTRMRAYRYGGHARQMGARDCPCPYLCCHGSHYLPLCTWPRDSDMFRAYDVCFCSSVGVNRSCNSSPFLSVMPTPDNKLRAFTKGTGIALRVVVMVEGRLRSSVVEWMYLGSSVQKLQECKLINTVIQVVERKNSN